MGRLVKDRRQSLLCQPPVLKLAAGVVGADRQNSSGAPGAEPSQYVFFQRPGKRWRCSHIKANLGPGVGPVGVLPPGPARGSKAPLELRVGYGVSVNNHWAVNSLGDCKDSHPMGELRLAVDRLSQLGLVHPGASLDPKLAGLLVELIEGTAPPALLRTQPTSAAGGHVL